MGITGFGTFSHSGGTRFAGLVRDDRVLALPGTTTRDLLADVDNSFPELLARTPDETWLPLNDLTVHAPVEPHQVFQCGANYRTHVIDLAVAHGAGERDEVAAMMDRRAANGTPYLFLGLPSAVTGPYDDVVLPGYSEQHDWELELVAVIGKPAFRVSREQALDHVAAYTVGNDLTTRDLVFRKDMKEIGTDWFRAKNAPGFLPLGPYLVPASLVDPTDLHLELRVNGTVMQDESTKDMLFDVAAMVEAASQITTLLPGDLVLTGSPAGNGMASGVFLKPGDVIDASITGLGAQRTEFTA
ncbi:hydrolase [Lentzea pudingi]|uniref:Hydrolase n=1 Tax=Lentzea pudingi TaxID=1789439 RepID=A0ABQ2I193_9PSEU|nr:fumarylacetoacetate hydrolase family protein [Lentzea pudingi]GGM94817.1 hydrolase [Lentzea pudingi]